MQWFDLNTFPCCNNYMDCCKQVYAKKTYEYESYVENNARPIRCGCWIEITRDDGEIFLLLVQSYFDKFGPPKGGVDDNETSFNCAVRETKEETTIDISKYITPGNFRSYGVGNIMYKTVLPSKFYHVNINEAELSNEITCICIFNVKCLRNNADFVSKHTNYAFRRNFKY